LEAFDRRGDGAEFGGHACPANLEAFDRRGDGAEFGGHACPASLEADVRPFPLKTADGMYSGERNKGARYQNALGSMRETLSCIEVGVALGYVVRVDAEVEARIRRIIGTLVRLIGR
jgi:hypothetical protein